VRTGLALEVISSGSASASGSIHILWYFGIDRFPPLGERLGMALSLPCICPPNEIPLDTRDAVGRCASTASSASLRANEASVRHNAEASPLDSVQDTRKILLLQSALRRKRSFIAVNRASVSQPLDRAMVTRVLKS